MHRAFDGGFIRTRVHAVSMSKTSDCTNSMFIVDLMKILCVADMTIECLHQVCIVKALCPVELRRKYGVF